MKPESGGTLHQERLASEKGIYAFLGDLLAQESWVKTSWVKIGEDAWRRFIEETTPSDFAPSRRSSGVAL